MQQGRQMSSFWRESSPLLDASCSFFEHSVSSLLLSSLQRPLAVQFVNWLGLASENPSHDWLTVHYLPIVPLVKYLSSFVANFNARIEPCKLNPNPHSHFALCELRINWCYPSFLIKLYISLLCCIILTWICICYQTCLSLLYMYLLPRIWQWHIVMP